MPPLGPTESSIKLSMPPATVLLDLSVESRITGGAGDGDARSHVERIAGSQGKILLKNMAGELFQGFKLLG